MTKFSLPRHTFLIAALALSAGPAFGQSLALKRVLLSSGGVAYLEHEAEIDGVVSLPLSVRLDQVDDVLKSIVVYDESGRVGAVSLAGRRPLAQLFSDLPFDQAALSSPIRLLNALQGAEIEATGVRTVRGRIVRATAETVRLADGGGTATRHRLTVQSGEGLQSLIVEDAQSVRFLDPALRAQIEQALSATARHRVRDRRTLEIAAVGTKRRTLRVGYVVEAPLWKATYRLTSGEGDRAYLQGWAVVENLSGADWSNVELTLASGNPVTFRQALYEAYYVTRPWVPVSVGGRVLPRPDSGGVAQRSAAGGTRGEPSPQEARMKRSFSLSGLAAVPEQKVEAGHAVAPAAPAGTAVAAAAMSQVTFRFPDTVTLGTGRSAMLPIVSRDVPARAVALYQPDRQQLHPFAALELENDGATALPPGVVTHYRSHSGAAANYVGDAELRALPAGERRLLSFALDSSMRIDRRFSNRSVLVSAGLAGEGVLRQSYTHFAVTEYAIASRAGDDRELLIEQPRRAGWTLEAPAGENVTLLPDRYRLRIRLDPKGATAFTVTEKRPSVERVRIGALPLDRIEAYARDGQLDDGLRKLFSEIAVLKRSLAAAAEAVRRLEREQSEIVADQDRLRKNLARVPPKSALHGRYLARLSQQEDRLEALRTELGAARAVEQKARRAIGDFIARM